MNPSVNFPEKPGHPRQNLARVQKKLLDMADVETDILDRNGISDFITFGTLLGSVWHGGFIPWNDDFDLMLFDDEYEKALAALRQELLDGLIVHDRLTDLIFWPSWSRVRDLHSSAKALPWPDDNAHCYTSVKLALCLVTRRRRSQVDLHRAKEHLEFLCASILQERWLTKCMTRNLTSLRQNMRICCRLWSPQLHLATRLNLHLHFLILSFVEGRAVLPLKKYDFCGRKYWRPSDVAAGRPLRSHSPRDD